MDSAIEKLLDDTGRKILRLLCADARISYAEIGRTVHLSTPAVIERIEKMEAAGLIVGYHAQLNPALLGYNVSAIVTLTTEPSHYDAVREIVRESVEIETCEHVTGDASFKMRVSTTSIEHLERVIRKFTHLGTTDTVLVLSSFESGGTTLNRLHALDDTED